MDNIRVRGSRKNTGSIMANPHYGHMLLKKDGIEMYVPEHWINQDGSLKRFAKKMWNKMLADTEKKKEVI